PTRHPRSADILDYGPVLSREPSTLPGMTNPALLWNAPKPPAREPRPGKRVFSMLKDGMRLDAELRERGEFGCECQFGVDGELAHGRLWRTRAGALAEAEPKRREYE